ncbi:MAG: hypothetical protein NT080_00160 [Spirochaetes bacterium]|nr:hypothetical protein [Spirochaetota bacterium]
METWIVADDGKHNAFTDIVFWHDSFWLAYVSSPSHFASRKSRVILLRSGDARHWQETGRFDGSGQDIRDPKLATIQGRLFLYALLNRRFNPEPYAAIAASSGDGLAWTPFEGVTPGGWLIGRPITSDAQACYAPAHRIDQGSAVLLKSANGLNWTVQGAIFDGNEERADETAIQFLGDGRMIAVTRLESGGGLCGSSRATTLISVAAFPFSSWTQVTRSGVTRLDGPNLFSANGKVFAVGRRQPRVVGPFQLQGSAFSRKRTAVFMVNEDTEGLVHLMDLPSSGDTSYPGSTIAGGKVFISYYTSDPHRDYPWLLGMLLPTRIQVAALEIAGLGTQGD